MRAAGILLGVILLLCPMRMLHVSAESPQPDGTLEALWEAGGIPDLLEEQGMAELASMYPQSDEEAGSTSLGDLVRELLSKALQSAAAPLRMLAMLTGVILLASLTDSLQGTRTETAGVYDTVCVLCAVGVMAEPLSDVFLQAAEMLRASSVFMLSFSTIFAAVLTVSGGITAAAGYQGMMVGLCEIAMQLSVHVLFPMLSMGLAMSIVDAVNPAVSLEGLVRMLHKAAVWLLGFLMSLFLGLLSVQSMMSLSADRLTSRTTKYMIANAVPFVGSAVSDAYASVLGSMGVLRSTTGVIGIAAVLTILLPVLVHLGLYRLTLGAGQAIAGLFGVSRLERLLKNTENVMAAAFSVAVSFSVMFVVSTAVMLLLGSGTAA